MTEIDQPLWPHLFLPIGQKIALRQEVIIILSAFLFC